MLYLDFTGFSQYIQAQTLQAKVWDYFHLFYTVCFQNKTAVLSFAACGSLLKLIVKPLLPVIWFLSFMYVYSVDLNAN